MKSFYVSIFCAFIGFSTINAQSFRSIMFNPPGSDNGLEFFEITGTASQSLSGLSFIEIDGDAGNIGIINTVKDLSSYSLGTNGLLLWRDGGTIIQPGPDAATTVVINDFNPDLQNGTGTFLIVDGFTGAVNDDIDSDNDGTANATLPWTSVVASVSVKAATSDTGYFADDFGGTVILSPVGRGFVYFDNSQWFFDDVTGSASGMFISTGANNGRQVAPGQTSSVLPIELAYFNVEKKDKQVSIEWKTLSEQNNAQFIIERSADGIQYRAIGTITGAGSTLETSNYHFMDENPIEGLNYYRLKQVDFDGAFSYGAVKSIMMSSKAHDIQILPSVTHSTISIKGIPNNENTQLDIIQLSTGRIMKSFTILGDKFDENISVASFVPGTYVVRMLNNQEVLVKRFVVVR